MTEKLDWVIQWVWGQPGIPMKTLSRQQPQPQTKQRKHKDNKSLTNPTFRKGRFLEGVSTTGLTDVCLMGNIMCTGVVLGFWNRIVTLDFFHFAYLYDVTRRKVRVFHRDTAVEYLWRNKPSVSKPETDMLLHKAFFFIFNSAHLSTSNNRNSELNNVE